MPTTQLMNGEKLIPLPAAARSLPGHRGNETLDASTLFRWITRGVKSMAGNVVKLEAVRVGHRWLTSNEALARFSAALASTEAPSNLGSARPTDTPAARRKASEAADRRLAAAGA